MRYFIIMLLLLGAPAAAFGAGRAVPYAVQGQSYKNRKPQTKNHGIGLRNSWPTHCPGEYGFPVAI